jgi:uncharacterized protein YndB with AHSA1/START domain
MSGQAMAASVMATMTVNVSQVKAFEVFTLNYASWVPEGQFLGSQRPAAIVIEPRVGGRWFERAADGAEMDWGRVLAYEPSSRIRVGWHLNAAWQFVDDPKQASDVDVRFIAEGPTKTRVEIEHRGFDRHGPDGEAIRAAVSSEMGWSLTLARFAAAANATKA